AVADAETALAEAEESMARLLPDGLDTPGQRLWTVQDRDAEAVGLLWVHLQEELAFIYDIEMRESVRGLGYGTQTLRAAAEHTREGFVGTEAIWSADASAADASAPNGDAR